MSACEKYQQILHRILDGEASDGERAAAERHNTVCRACADAFRSLEGSLDLLSSMPVPAPAPEFTARTVERALWAKKIRSRRMKAASWGLGVLMVLISASLAASWSAVMQPVAWLGFRGVLTVLLKGMALWSVFDKLQAILARLLSLAGDIGVEMVLGKGGPAFWGCLMLMLLAGAMFAVHRIRMPGGSIKRG